MCVLCNPLVNQLINIQLISIFLGFIGALSSRVTFCSETYSRFTFDLIYILLNILYGFSGSFASHFRYIASLVLISI